MSWVIYNLSGIYETNTVVKMDMKNQPLYQDSHSIIQYPLFS